MTDEVDDLIANLHFVGDKSFIFAVPLDAPPELQKRMFAGMKSYFKELRYGKTESIDQLLKEVGDKWRFEVESRTELQVLVDEMVTTARRELENTLAACTRNPRWTDNTTLGGFVGASAVFRLRSTFTAAALMTRFGYGYEGAALIRLILEQIAWAYSIRNAADLSVLHEPPTGRISELRSLAPWTGRLYGWLSDRTHIDPDLTREYIQLSEDLHRVLMRQPTKWSAPLAWCFVIVTDLCNTVAEIVFRADSSGRRHTLLREDGSVGIRDDRPLLPVLDKFERFAPAKLGVR
jgi:hypothetical protein